MATYWEPDKKTEAKNEENKEPTTIILKCPFLTSLSAHRAEWDR